MKLIDISTKKHPNIYAMVDDADFKHLNKWKWYPVFGARTQYARRSRDGISVSMHRELLKPEKEMEIDHIDRNGLNNQRENLRICTRSENMMNTRILKNNKSGYVGVSYDKNEKKWKAAIKLNNKKIFLGYFQFKEDAARARDAGTIKYHRPFSRLNFPKCDSATLSKGPEGTETPTEKKD